MNEGDFAGIKACAICAVNDYNLATAKKHSSFMYLLGQWSVIQTTCSKKQIQEWLEIAKPVYDFKRRS